MKQEKMVHQVPDQRLEFAVLCSAFERALASYQGSLSAEQGCKFITIVDATMESYKSQLSSRSGAVSARTQQPSSSMQGGTIHDMLYR